MAIQDWPFHINLSRPTGLLLRPTRNQQMQGRPARWRSTSAALGHPQRRRPAEGAESDPCTHAQIQKDAQVKNTFAVYGCIWLSYIWLHVWHRYRRLKFETRNRQTFPYKGRPLNETADVLLPSLNQWGKCQGEHKSNTKLLHEISLSKSPRHKDLREIETANSPVDEGSCAWRSSSSSEAWLELTARPLLGSQ